MATGWTDAGLAAVTSALGTTFYIALGTGTTAYGRTQTALVAETSASGLARAAATVTRQTTTVANDTLRMTKTFTAVAAGPTVITETGTFDAASTGNMYARGVLPVSRSLVASDTHAVTVNHIFAI